MEISVIARCAFLAAFLAALIIARTLAERAYAPGRQAMRYQKYQVLKHGVIYAGRALKDAQDAAHSIDVDGNEKTGEESYADLRLAADTTHTSPDTAASQFSSEGVIATLSHPWMKLLYLCCLLVGAYITGLVDCIKANSPMWSQRMMLFLWTKLVSMRLVRGPQEFNIMACCGGRCLTVSDGSPQAIQTRTPDGQIGNSNQRFTFEDAGGGYFWIRHVISQLVFDCGNCTSDAPLTLQPQNDARNQLFRFQKITSGQWAGWYNIQPKNDNKLELNVYKAKDKNLIPIKLYKATSRWENCFKLRPCSQRSWWRFGPTQGVPDFNP